MRLSDINLVKYHGVYSPGHTCVIRCLSILLNKSLEETAKTYFDVDDVDSLTVGYELEQCIEYFKRANIHTFWNLINDQSDRSAIRSGVHLLAVSYRRDYPDHACISVDGKTSDHLSYMPGVSVSIDEYRCVYAYAPIFLPN